MGIRIDFENETLPVSRAIVGVTTNLVSKTKLVGSVMMKLGFVDIEIVVVGKAPSVPVVPDKQDHILTGGIVIIQVFSQGNARP